jgi:hypothetical protein
MLGTISGDTAVNEGVLLGWKLGLGQPALTQPMESLAEALRHEGVDDGVDSTVQVDAKVAEEKEAEVEVGWAQEGIHHHQGEVGQPQQSKKDHHHSQHLGDLPGKMGKEEYVGVRAEP